MAGRTTLSEVQEGAVRAALVRFSRRDGLLVLMALHTGFRIHELLSITVAQVYEKSGHDLELTRAALGHCNIGTTQRYLATSEEAAAAAILAL